MVSNVTGQSGSYIESVAIGGETSVNSERVGDSATADGESLGGYSYVYRFSNPSAKGLERDNPDNPG